MSFSSFFAGLTGLKSNSERLSVIGNNLANLNTIGFKASRATFSDIYNAAGGVAFSKAGNPMQLGRGVQFAGIDQIFSQGSFQNTTLLTDISLQGNGFFVVSSPEEGPKYSRAGNFSFDADGYLRSANGQFVQGFTSRGADGSILRSGAVGDITIPSGTTAPPQATETMQLFVNLNGAAQVDDPATAGFDESLNGRFVTTITVYDSLGGAHDVTLTFTPQDTDADLFLDEWTFEATLPGDEVTGGTAGTPFVIGSGTVQFDADGNLVAPGGNVTLNVPGFNNGAAAQTIEWQFYDDDGSQVITGWEDQSSVVSAVSQDGYGSGILRTLVIDAEGLISGIFTNGATVELARLAIANFTNENGLLRDGDNMFLATNTSGPPSVGAANTGGRGATVANTLELSNVDITEEFTSMIISQRGYQANSRIITTTDEVIQEALSLKR